MSADVLDVVDVDQLPDDDDDQGDAADVDQDAPYGFLKDGVTPRRKPGPAPGAGKTLPPPRARRRGRTTSRRGGSSSTSTPRAAAAGIDPTMLAGARALIAIPAQMFGLAGLATGLASKRYAPDTRQHTQMRKLATALSADSAMFVIHGEDLAEGMAPLADELPFLAGVYAKAAQLGPYSKLLQTALLMTMQGLTNHGVIPAHPMLGTVPPEELVAQVMGAGG